MAKFRVSNVHKVFLQIKKFLFALFNATAESVNCSLFLKHLKNIFEISVIKTNFIKHIENLPQHLSQKHIGDIIYRLPTTL